MILVSRSFKGILAIAALASLIFFADGALGKSPPAEGKLLDRALTAISRHYVEPSRINPKAMLDGALDQMQRRIPEILVTDRESGQLAVTVGLASKRVKASPMSSLTDLSRTMHEVLAFVVPHYSGDTDTPPEDIEYAAIDGMLEALDPHSNFMPPKVYNEFRVGTTGKFGGLGIVISIKDGMLTVIAPIEGTPASRAGIKAGDRIMQIDEESTINMSLTDAVNKLRGDVGTKVTIVVERPGGPARKISLERAVINIDSVQHSLLAGEDKRIGYIKIKSFQDNTDDDVRTALKDLHKDGAALDGLILDMRNNPGGLLNIASDVVDEFLRKGIIVSTVGPREQVVDQSVAHAGGTEPDYPIVVLINEGSASASEIVAGALAANDRAITMGQRSFGKGSVQTLFDLGDDAALKLTIAQYEPAGTVNIQLVGITPDIELLPKTVDPAAMNIVENETTREQDLEKHLDNSLPAESGLKTLPNSTFKVSFLQPKEDEKKSEERSLKEYSKAPDLTGDFAVELARTLIAKAGMPVRKEMLSGAGPVIKEAEAAQQALIDGALKAQGIDWASIPASGAPKLSLAYHVFKGK
ncbi:MAG: S41 family peptidase, partial [bacterium]